MIYARKFLGVWRAMNNRCYLKTSSDYRRYGARGIQVEWKTFEKFKQDMFISYCLHKKKHNTTTIERKNNDNNYSKQNCKWATQQEQAKNKSKHYNTGKNHPQYNKPIKEETKLKISKTVKEQWKKGLYARRINGMLNATPWNKNKKWSEETKLKMSESAKKRWTKCNTK